MKSSFGPFDVPGWTARRQTLYERLEERARPLAGLYASATFFLNTTTWPGRHNLLGHTVREIVQRLPDFLDPQPRSREDLIAAAESLVAAWHDAGLSVGPADGEVVSSSFMEERDTESPVVLQTDPSSLAIPRFVAEAAANFVWAHDGSSTNNYDKAASIILKEQSDRSASVDTDRGASRDATVVLWTTTCNWFLKLTHVSANTSRPPPSQEELMQKFEVIEGMLEAILAPFYNVIDDLDGYLAATNAPAGSLKSEPPSGSPDHSSGSEGNPA